MEVVITSEQARDIAERAHAGQVDKAGVDYIHHCEAVARFAAELGAEDELVATAWLHDTIEDTDVTVDELRAGGASERQLRVLRLLTHTGLERDAYLAAICADPDAALVKRADNMHNGDPARLASLADDDTRERLIAKYTGEAAQLDAALERHGVSQAHAVTLRDG
jgi:(p)ppGpp synthase/HD superfamily hydrolase